MWARDSAVGRGTSRILAVSIPNKVIQFFILPNISNRGMALGSKQPLTEMSTRDLPAVIGTVGA
jgi:hypothetical protein